MCSPNLKKVSFLFYQPNSRNTNHSSEASATLEEKFSEEEKLNKFYDSLFE